MEDIDKVKALLTAKGVSDSEVRRLIKLAQGADSAANFTQLVQELMQEGARDDVLRDGVELYLNRLKSATENSGTGRRQTGIEAARADARELVRPQRRAAAAPARVAVWSRNANRAVWHYSRGAQGDAVAEETQNGIARRTQLTVAKHLQKTIARRMVQSVIANHVQKAIAEQRQNAHP